MGWVAGAVAGMRVAGAGLVLEPHVGFFWFVWYCVGVVGVGDGAGNRWGICGTGRCDAE